MDKRKNNGAKKGEHRGQGRKPKAEELELIEKLTPLEEKAFRALESGIEKGDFAFVRLYFEYLYGKPRQQYEGNDSNERVIVIDC